MQDSRIKPYSEQYAAWSDQLKDLTDRWGKIGLLSGIKDPYHKSLMAVVLENQRLVNELTDDAKGDLYPQFRRISIPVVRRVFGTAPFLNWVGVQPMLGPYSDLFFKGVGEEWDAESVIAKTRFLKTEWPHAVLTGPYKSAYAIDHEAEVTAILATDLSDELCHEVIKDLRNNCATETVSIGTGVSQARAVNNVISYSSKNLRGSLGRHEANWIIVSEKMHDLFLSDPEYGFTADDELTWSHVGKVFYAGKLKNDHGEWKVYCDRAAEDNKVLMGYRGNWTEAGYFYCPYVFLTNIPATPMSDGSERHRMMTRYAKKLRRGGSNYYRMVTINNVVFAQDEPQFEEAGEARSTCTLRIQTGELAGDAQDQPAELDGPGELVPEGVSEPVHDCDDRGGHVPGE